MVHTARAGMYKLEGAGDLREEQTWKTRTKLKKKHPEPIKGRNPAEGGSHEERHNLVSR